MSSLDSETLSGDSMPMWRRVSDAEYASTQAARPLSRAFALGANVPGFRRPNNTTAYGAWSDNNGRAYDVTFSTGRIGLYSFEKVDFMEQKASHGDTKYGASVYINDDACPPVIARTEVDPETNQLWRVPEAEQPDVWKTFKTACTELGRDILRFVEVDDVVLVFSADIAAPIYQMRRTF